MHVRLGCGSLSIIIPVSLLANAFDVRSVLHGLVSLAAVNQICAKHEPLMSIFVKKTVGAPCYLTVCFKHSNCPKPSETGAVYLCINIILPATENTATLRIDCPAKEQTYCKGKFLSVITVY